jgi:hypothetical protein
MQAELISFYEGFNILERCYNLLKKFEDIALMRIVCDNQAAIACIKEPSKNLPRYMSIKAHYLKSKLKEYGESLEVIFVNSEENLADMFTKALGKNLFKSAKSKLHIENYIRMGSVEEKT